MMADSLQRILLGLNIFLVTNINAGENKKLVKFISGATIVLHADLENKADLEVFDDYFQKEIKDNGLYPNHEKCDIKKIDKFARIYMESIIWRSNYYTIYNVIWLHIHAIIKLKHPNYSEAEINNISTIVFERLKSRAEPCLITKKYINLNKPDLENKIDFFITTFVNSYKIKTETIDYIYSQIDYFMSIVFDYDLTLKKIIPIIKYLFIIKQFHLLLFRNTKFYDELHEQVVNFFLPYEKPIKSSSFKEMRENINKCLTRSRSNTSLWIMHKTLNLGHYNMLTFCMKTRSFKKGYNWTKQRLFDRNVLRLISEHLGVDG